MTERTKEGPNDVSVFRGSDGRDEMNLCEFPFFILDTRTRGEPRASYSREVRRNGEQV